MPVVPRIDRPPMIPSRRLSGLFRQRLAARDRDLDLDVACIVCCRRHLGDGIADHAARHRIDCWLARFNREARACDGPNSLSGTKSDAAAGRTGAHRRQHQGTVGDVRIVAGVLDHAGGRRRCVVAVDGERKGWTFAARQGHLDRIGELAREQRRIGGLGGRGGAGAGGPAPAERTGLRAHDLAYSRPDRRRHERACG